MDASLKLPTALSARAERRTWFDAEGVRHVLDWLDANSVPLLGIDTARKMNDGNWMLLLDPMLSTTLDDGVSIATGRNFVNEHAAPDLMFEPVWPGY